MARRKQQDYLPEDFDAERALLGAALNGQFELIRSLSPDDFSRTNHREIYTAMTELYTSNQPIKSITVVNQLQKTPGVTISDLNGPSYLSSLYAEIAELVPSVAESYLNIVVEKAKLRRVIAAAERLKDLAYQEMETAEEIATRGASTLVDITRNTEKAGRLRRISEIFAENPQGVLDPSTRPKGVPTGFLSIDEKTGGLREGELIIVAARPAMGKTSFALNVASNIALHNRVGDRRGVAVFSLEMPEHQLIDRLLCAEGRVDSLMFRLGRLTSDDRHKISTAAGNLDAAPIYMNDRARTLFDIRAAIVDLLEEDPLVKVVIVDYLQLMQAGAGRFENRQQEISFISRQFKLMARDLGVCMVVLAQLSRAPEVRAGDHRPILSDLRESGAIEQDADIVAFIYREEVYRPDKESLKGVAEIILGKQRHGPTGTCKIAYLNKFTLFANPAMQSDVEPEDHKWVPPAHEQQGLGYEGLAL